MVINRVVSFTPFTLWQSYNLISTAAGISPIFGNVSSVPIIYIVLHRIRLVRSIAGEKVLHEAVQLVRLDARGIIDCCHAELPNYTEHI